MKKFGILSIVLIMIVLVAVICAPSQQQPQEYLRIHIRANSNATSDQDVKYAVKEAVVQALTPALSGVQTKQQAIEVVEENLDLICQTADGVLQQQGKSYRSTARVCRETFPDRTYEDLTLQAGVYDALIVELGSGSGDNWWCVVFPPLCFGTAETQSVVYRSWFADMFRKIFLQEKV